MPIMLSTQETEIRRLTGQSHPRQIVPKTLSQKTLHKNRAHGVTQGEGPEFKPQYNNNNKKSISSNDKIMYKVHMIQGHLQFEK
jgi:hypothetical protein